ncbi:MAG: bifunctional folylpolyglutamate synthase/dihydrofolate synthase [Gammaproteobacteria bacterium]
MRTLDDWLAYQQAQHPRDIDLGLDRVGAVARRLGLLPWAPPTVIVGGTNGKGSTTAFLTALGRAAGLRTGTYNSPHLQRYNERVSVDGEPVDDATLVDAFERIEAVRDGVPLTFFEYGTRAALLAFRAHGCGFVVLEVGLGGRLDATNIVDADVAVLCSVGLDHTDWLGPTREHIGREKAGIFRAGRPVVLGSADMPQSVGEALAALGCEALWPGRDFHVEPIEPSGSAGQGRWRWRGSGASLAGLTVHDLPAPVLPGPIQYHNAAAAIAAFTVLCRRRAELADMLPPASAAAADAAAAEPVATALRIARLRGRFQRIAEWPAGGPEWILDVAHNAEAAQVLAQALTAQPAAGRTYAVAGILQDKDAAAIGTALQAVIDGWVLVGLPGDRGGDPEALRRRLPESCRSLALAPDVEHGCGAALALAQRGDRIVVLGSFLTVGPALDWLGI